MYAELYLLSGQHFSDPRCRQHIGGHGQRHVRAGAGRHRDSGHRQANPAGFSGCGGERARNLSCRVSPAAWSRIQRRCKLMTHTSRSRIGRVVDLVGCTPGRLAPALRTGPEVWASCWCLTVRRATRGGRWHGYHPGQASPAPARQPRRRALPRGPRRRSRVLPAGSSACAGWATGDRRTPLGAPGRTPSPSTAPAPGTPEVCPRL
jgi:hypothetical protein